MDRIILGRHGDCKVVEAIREDIYSIYPFMRKIDQLEAACMGLTAKQSLIRGLNSDDLTLTALDKNDVPFAMFGCGLVDGMGYIWCVGTDGIEDNSYNFIKASRKWTQIMTKPYGVTFNFVHAENKTAIKWLKFCKAQFINELTFKNEPFFEFIIKST